MNVPQKPMNPRRKKCSHTIHAKGYANDDEVSLPEFVSSSILRKTGFIDSYPPFQLDINTQSSSHWDGLRHYPYQSSLQYYNGVTQEDISGDNANTKIGIQSKLPPHTLNYYILSSPACINNLAKHELTKHQTLH